MTFDRDNEMDFENRVIAPEYVPEDAEVENPLRPRTFADYVGQEKVKENLEVFIQAAQQRKESLDLWPAGPRQNDACGYHRK